MFFFSLCFNLKTEFLNTVGAKANRRTGAVCLKLPRAQLLLLLKLFPVDEEKIAQSALKSFDAHAASRYFMWRFVSEPFNSNYYRCSVWAVKSQEVLLKKVQNLGEALGLANQRHPVGQNLQSSPKATKSSLLWILKAKKNQKQIQ
jgi:hypothetical protein